MRPFVLSAFTATLSGCVAGEVATAPDSGPIDHPALSLMALAPVPLEGMASARAVNDAGQIAGASSVFNLRAALWVNGLNTLLIADGDGGTTSAADLSGQGLVVGSAREFPSFSEPDPPFDAASWDHGAFARLSRFDPDADEFPVAVNDAGQIVGHSVANAGVTAVFWSDRADPTPTAIGGSQSRVADINNAGTIVGSFSPTQFTTEPAVWSSASSAPQPLKGPNGGPCGGAATSINHRSEIVGHCAGTGGIARAAYWADPLANALLLAGEAFSEALGINELGQIAGATLGTLEFALSRPVIWNPELGGFRQIELSLPADVSSTEFLTAYDINNFGEVTGDASGNAAYRWSLFARAAIDVLPGSTSNRVKLDGRGSLAVAVLGSRWFRAADVDPASLTLGDELGAETQVSLRRAVPITKLTDVNRDGFGDLVAEFNVRTLMDIGDLGALTSSLVLNGRFRSGRAVRGADVVQPIP
jgi:uncharacterized membrane protein